MKFNWWIVGILLAFILGMAIGTGLGMQKGQYMLFEGLDGIFDGAEINIDLNETIIVEKSMEALKPYIEESMDIMKDDNVLKNCTDDLTGRTC